MTGFLVVFARGSYEQIGVCMLVTIVYHRALAVARPYLLARSKGGEVLKNAPRNNDVAEAM